MNKIFDLIEQERVRQDLGIELIASENYVSADVLRAQGSILTNKYAEGYPGKRYYGGCEFVDEIEKLAIDALKELFSSSYANVQPHSGSQANMAAYLSLANLGDTILGMDLSAGGHLTHGAKVSFSGKFYIAETYTVDTTSHLLDYRSILEKAREVRPKIIIAGASSYPRAIDFKKFREIADEVGAYLLVDMAHIAGLVAVGAHDSPIPYAHVVTSTTHKTLRGPRGGIILTNSEELAKRVNANIFPGIQGGPLQHVIAAKGIAFAEAKRPFFAAYIGQVVANAKYLAELLQDGGLDIITGGTDNHLLIASTLKFNLNGKDAEVTLERGGITCNKNMIPGDKLPPSKTSGIRLGTAAITTRGFKEREIKKVASFILAILKNPDKSQQVKMEVEKLCKEFPLSS
jgi:glycine hydroxymethyltransferase